MSHPIANNRRNLIVYGVFWLLIAAMHGAFLYSFYQASIYLAIADSLIYSLVYALTGLGLWYAVKFSQMETNNVGNLIVNHLTTVSITIVAVLFIAYNSLHSIPMLREGYADFFSKTLIWRVFTSLVIYILIVLVYYLIMYYSNFIEKIKKESELESNIKAAELNVLKSQINPHFLFNSLNSISALTITESQQARDMILKLSDFLRISISEKPDTMRTFSLELEHISGYLDIEKVRFGDKLHVEHNIAKKCHDARVPSLILQPLIENAVKHGLSESLGRVEIRITADCFHGFLKIQVENNFDPEGKKVKTGSGIGLQNIAQRLKLIYNREDLMRVGVDGNKFLVTLTFPQNDLDDKSNYN